MDANQLRRLREAFAACGRTASPLGRTLCEALAPSPEVAELFRQFYRTISAEAPDVRLFLSGLHYLALTGEEPGLAAHFPSCGGQLSDPVALAAVAPQAVAAGRESLLDYMLSREVRPWAPHRAADLAHGLCAVAEQFGGGVSLVEYHGGTGLNLLLGEGVPPVVGRYGLDPAPLNPADEADRVLLESFYWPDAVDDLRRLRAATSGLAARGPLDLREGRADSDLLPLLTEAYAAMPPGNTLVVLDVDAWPDLTDAERQQIAWQIQRLAAHLEPHKPLAWLQAGADLRLHTFGWNDPEDRLVRTIKTLE